MTIDRILVAGTLFAALLISACQAQSQDSETSADTPSNANLLTVHHDPNCGCCGKWIEHMEQNGFTVDSKLETNMNAIKRELGVPENLPSCHTATVAGYVIEGHVPAADVQRLLDERPDAKGLSVPGMPLGSPGMEYNDRRQAYDVVLFDESGETEVFNHYPAKLD